jgi:hypothetical protein
VNFMQGEAFNNQSTMIQCSKYKRAKVLITKKCWNFSKDLE